MSPFTSVSDFKYVSGDLSSIDLSVDIMPSRSGSGVNRIYGKDVAVLMEMIAERWRAIGYTSASYTFSKTLTLSTVTYLISEIQALAATGKFLNGTPTSEISATEKTIEQAYSALSVKTQDLPSMTTDGNRLVYSTIQGMFAALKLLNKCWLPTVYADWSALIQTNAATYTNTSTGETWTETLYDNNYKTTGTAYYHEKASAYPYTSDINETSEYLTTSSGNAAYPITRSQYQSDTDALSFVAKHRTNWFYGTSGGSQSSGNAYGLLCSTATTQPDILTAMRSQFLAYKDIESHTASGDWFYYDIYGSSLEFHPYGNINAHTYADY